MKIILSRKGFDSSFGRVASPIFKDGLMISLPIPADSSISYNMLSVPGRPGLTFPSLVSDLGGDMEKGRVHLDPDLNSEIYPPRDPAWNQLFGQSGIAQQHLENQKVDVDDLFLFFGWFREVENDVNGKYSYKSDAKDQHIIFGWLQVGKIWQPQIKPTPIPLWAEYHPHCEKGLNPPEPHNNTIYVAKDNLEIDSVKGSFPGGGVFKNFRDELRLTKPNQYKRSLWELPEWFYPIDPPKTPMTYHPSSEKIWSKKNGRTILQSARIGQEFVLDTEEYPEAIEWVESLFK
ncbi:MAG: hypothetical protein NT163_07500 [Chlorobiales bacterium]|nr:hypothetical protein [Chlorobiales bacterium]